MKTLLALLLLATSAIAAPTKVETFLAELPARLAKPTTADAVREVVRSAPDGIEVTESKVSNGSLSITLQFAAKDAGWLIGAWKLVKPYALSTDVHQKSWTIQLFDQDVPDKYGKRIATNPIELGAWTVWPRLAGRPEGALPKVSAGASPAYDLAKYKASVVSLEITKR